MPTAATSRNEPIFSRPFGTAESTLLQLLNDVLDISKIEAGQLQVETITCSPHQLLAEVVSVLRVPARKKGITLDYRWESAIPETIQSDPHRLKQLLMNLVNNAIKFTDEGSVLIVGKACSTSGKVPMVRFEVRDTGIGIPAEKLETIFRPFVQADTTRSPANTAARAWDWRSAIESPSRSAATSPSRATSATAASSPPRSKPAI